jgi:hypothetical protein
MSAIYLVKQDTEKRRNQNERHDSNEKTNTDTIFGRTSFKLEHTPRIF